MGGRKEEKYKEGMEHESLNEVVVKEEENTNEEHMMSMKEKQEKKEKAKQEEDKGKENNGRKKESEEDSRKVKEKKKKKVEEENQKEREENKKEKEKKQEVDMMGKMKNIEEEKKRKEFMKKKDKQTEQQKHMKELVKREKEEYEKLEGMKRRNIYPQFFKAIYPKKPIEKLRIPPAFNKLLENEYLGEVSLRGPSGNTWHAKLVQDSEGFYFTHGWNEFFIDHSINLGDFLFFGYDGQSQFSIRIFDLTGCEKQSAFLACPSKDVTKKYEKGLMTIDTVKTLPYSHEDYNGHKAMGGLQEDVDDLSNYVANTSEKKDQGQGVDVVDTLQNGERESMVIYTHDNLKDESLLDEFSGSSRKANDRLSRASFDNKRKGNN
ncbi:unnamed protein product [Urochloa humidicola]